MPAWRVFYSDLSTFDSDDGEPHEAPTEGFICAVGYDERGKRYVMHGWDFYCWKNNQWWGMNQFGLHDMLRRNDLYAYKEGRTVANSVWVKIQEMAVDDPDFPVKRRGE